jgi:hypothetical protein
MQALLAHLESEQGILVGTRSPPPSLLSKDSVAFEPAISVSSSSDLDAHARRSSKTVPTTPSEPMPHETDL